MTTALVTGASAGLGAQFCAQLAASGHDLVVVARNAQRLEWFAAAVRQRYGVRVETLVADLADREQLQIVADRVAGAGPLGGAGQVDLLVNNAGFGIGASFTRSPVALEERALDVMCRAVLVLCHAAAPPMGRRGYGGIINVSSVAAYSAMGSYSAAKAWVTTFSEALAVELAPRGVVVTAVCPGFTRTEFHGRAQLDMSWLPDGLWLRAQDVVADALQGARLGRPVSVPGWQYQALTTVLRVAPRRVVAAGSVALARARRNRSAGGPRTGPQPRPLSVPESTDLSVSATSLAAVTDSSARTRLLDLVKAQAIVHGRVTLSSGKEADYYVDLRRITLDGQASPLVGVVMRELTDDLDFDAVGGLTMGADPVATAMLHAAAADGARLDAFVVRKAEKAHGLQQRIEGPAIQGRRVLVVEDTSTTGGSPLTAVQACREAGAQVVAVAVIADRSSGAGERIEAETGLPYRYAYGLQDLGLA